jgi:phage FluMu gp28-like protein
LSKLVDFVKERKIKPEDVPQLLLPYQQKWVADTAGIKLYTKSRRIGISWCEAGDAALVAAQSNGMNCYYLGYEKDMARGFIEDAADWAKAYDLTASQIEEDEEVFRDKNEDYSIFVFRIYFNSGHLIEALSSKPRNLRSRQGRVIIDEAAFQDDLSGLLKAAKALRVWGGEIRLITTYNGIDNDYYELERDVLAGKFPSYSRHFTTFDDALQQGLYQRICLVNRKEWSVEAETAWREETFAEFGDDADEELLCIPSNSGGAYFSRVVVEACMHQAIPVLKLGLNDDFALLSEQERESEIHTYCEFHLAPLLEKANPNLNSYYGMDFARIHHLSVLIICQQQENLTRRVIFTLELRNIPFRQQEQILFYCVDRLPRFVQGAHDSRGNGHYLAEVANLRYTGRVALVMLSNEWYRVYMPKYKAALEDKKVILPASADLLQDHRQVVMTNGTPKVPEAQEKKGTDGKKRHGDGVIACCLMWFASEQQVMIMEPDFGTMEDIQPVTSSWRR